MEWLTLSLQYGCCSAVPPPERRFPEHQSVRYCASGGRVSNSCNPLHNKDRGILFPSSPSHPLFRRQWEYQNHKKVSGNIPLLHLYRSMRYSVYKESCLYCVIGKIHGGFPV